MVVEKDFIIFEALRVTKIWFGYLKEEKQIICFFLYNLGGFNQ